MFMFLIQICHSFTFSKPIETHLLHYVSHLVSKSLPDLLDNYEFLLRCSASLRAALEDQLNLYVFERENRELQNWLFSLKTLAESEDFGQDLEDVEGMYDAGWMTQSGLFPCFHYTGKIKCSSSI